MFRDKKFLVEHGLNKSARSDTAYILGYLYDAIVENNYIYDELISKIYKDRYNYIANHPDEFPKVYDKIVHEATILEKCQFDIFKDKNFQINTYINDKWSKPQ